MNLLPDHLGRFIHEDSFSKQDAETLRVRAQSDDFSWLPDVKFVGANVLGDANGAFDSDSNTIYITEGLEGVLEHDAHELPVSGRGVLAEGALGEAPVASLWVQRCGQGRHARDVAQSKGLQVRQRNGCGGKRVIKGMGTRIAEVGGVR